MCCHVYISYTLTALTHEKDTRRPLCSADEVEAGSNNVTHLPPPSQLFAHRHFKEVEGCIQAMLIQLQLVAQVVYLTFS